MSLLKTVGIIGGIAVFLLSATVVFAQSQTVTDIQGTAQEQIKTAREEVKARMETTREETKARIETAREETKTRMEDARKEAKARIEAVREEAKTRMETQREEAKQRLNDIRDKMKQQRAQHLTEQFDRLNKKWTDHFMQLLNRYEAILLKIQERADNAATNGKDTAAVNTSIQSAQTAIENARDAVVAQAVASYTLDISTLAVGATMTTEGQDELLRGFRTAFQDLHKTLFNDLFALRDGAIKDTRATVQAALQALSQIPKVDDDDDASTDDSNQ